MFFTIKKRSYSRYVCFVTYLLIIHALAGYAVYDSAFIKKIIKKNIAHSRHYHNMLSIHRRMDDSIPAGYTLFFGDSLTQSLAVSTIVKNAVNYGIGKDTSQGLLDRLAYYQSIKRAKNIVISIGTNDLKQHSATQIVNNLTTIINSIRSQTTAPIFVNEILLVDERNKRSKPRKNSVITDINKTLIQFISSIDNVTFIKVNHLLTDASNNLDTSYHVGDGLHLSTRGYQIWISQIQKALSSGKEK